MPWAYEQLKEARTLNERTADDIGANEDLFEEFGIPLSGVLAVDERILEQLRAVQQDDESQQQAEARRFSR